MVTIDWIMDAGMQRQAQIGLNKGEAHHALKRAISFHRRGEIRDRSGEGHHYRIAGMNLLAAIIIFWNTMKLGEVVNTRAASGTHKTVRAYRRERGGQEGWVRVVAGTVKKKNRH